MKEEFANERQREADDEKIDIQEVLFKYIIHWPWFVGAVLVCLIGAWIYLRMATPVYNISATVLIKDDKKGGNTGGMAGLEELGCIDTLQLYLKKMQLLASGKAIASKSTDINKQIAATKEQIGKAEYERKRTENLLKENAATQKQIDDIDSQIAVLKKQLEAQISTLQRGNASITEESSAYEIQVAQLDDQLRKCHITSPICGTVLAKYAEAGELATQGKPLFKVADVQHLFLRAYITADQLSQLKLGDKVKVFSDLGKDDRREYEGTITWISDKSEFTPKTIQTRDERANLVYATKIAVKNDGYIKIGMYGEMKK